MTKSLPMPQIDAISVAVHRLVAKLATVQCESISTVDAAGRILAEPLLADRDSPAISVSAMDGYAVRIVDISPKPLSVSGTTPAGSPPVELEPGNAIRIFTGAPVPIGADCIIKREDTDEDGDQVTIKVSPESVKHLLNIRTQAENTRRGEPILQSGTQLNSAAMAAVASFGTQSISVHKKVRITVLNTGDELAETGASVQPWQIRDSNGPSLLAWLATLPWVELIARRAVGDQLAEVTDALGNAIEQSDAVILTGGVSMGDADYVPEAIESIGGETVFHRLPMRPGRPVLGACVGSKLVLGLPGNPVSVAATSRVVGLPLIRHLGGRREIEPRRPLVRLANPDEKTLHLHWYRLARINSDGHVELVESLGSGDLVSLAQSDGFVELPAGESGAGPWRFYHWD